MSPEQADKIIYWMQAQRQAFKMIDEARALGYYYPTSYFAAWSERHAFCYQQIERNRNG